MSRINNITEKLGANCALLLMKRGNANTQLVVNTTSGLAYVLGLAYPEIDKITKEILNPRNFGKMLEIYSRIENFSTVHRCDMLKLHRFIPKK